MKGKFKRILSTILALVMVLALLPATALAGPNGSGGTTQSSTVTITLTGAVTGVSKVNVSINGTEYQNLDVTSYSVTVTVSGKLNTSSTTIVVTDAANPNLTGTTTNIKSSGGSSGSKSYTATVDLQDNSGSTTTDAQTVYVYVQITGDVPSGLVINAKGYYTIGTIQLNMPTQWTTTNLLTFPDGASNSGTYTGLSDALKNLTPYPANSGFDLSKINWRTLLGVSNGATDYVPDGWTWHLDGTISVNDIETCTVTYHDGVDTETIFADVSYQFVEGTLVPQWSADAPSRANYKFGGWITENGDTFDFTQSQSNDIDLYAKWIPDEYDITYELDGGTNGNNPAKYTYGVGVSSFADATKTGYTFGGWYTDNTFSTQVTSISTTETGDKTLYAKWTENTATIKYEVVGPEGCGTVSSDSETVKVVTGTAQGSTATATGDYYFVGWYSDKACSQAVTDGASGTTLTPDVPDDTANGTTINYYAKFANKETVVINVVGKTVERTYNGNEQSVNTGYDETYTVSGTTAANLPAGISISLKTNADKISGTNAGTYNGTLSGSSFTVTNTTAKYTVELKVTPGTLKINPKPVTVTLEAEDKVYDGTDAVETGKYTLTVKDDGNTVDGLTATATNVKFNDKNVADGKTVTASGVTLSGTAAGNYTLVNTDDTPVTSTTVTTTANITPETLSVSVAFEDKVYDGNASVDVAKVEITSGKIANDDVNVQYASGTKGTASDANVGENKTVTIANLTLSGTDKGNYTLNVTPGTVNITAKPVTVTADNASKTYGGIDPTLTATVTGLVEGEDKSLITYNVRRAAGENVGTYTITASGESTQDNYTVTYETGTFTITQADRPDNAKVTATSYNAPYDGNAHGITVSGKAEGDTLSYSTTNNGSDWSATAPMCTDVTNGDVTVYVKVTNPNYKDYTVSATITITKRDVTITVKDAEKYFDEPDPNFTGTVDGLVEKSDLGTITYSRTKGDSGDESVGTYDDVLTANYTENSNYSVTVVPGDFTIKTAPIPNGAYVDAKGGSQVYNGQSFAARAEVKGAEGYTVYYKVGSGDWTTTAPSVTNVSEGTVTVSVKASKTGYTDLTCRDITIAITPRPVTLTSATDSKVYDGTPLTNDTVEVTGDGFVEGEGATYTFTGSQTEIGSSENSFTYELIKDTKAENYIITTANGTLIVTAATGVEVTKEVITESGILGYGDIAWEVTVTNTGDSTAYGLKLVDSIEDVVIVHKAVTGETEKNPNNFDLETGESAVFTVTYTPTEVGTYANNIKVTQPTDDPENPDQTLDEDTAGDVNVVEPVTDVIVTKKANKTTADVGDTITWTITVTNNGNVDLKGITLTDTLKNAAGSAKLYDAEKNLIGPSEYTFNLAAGETATFTAKYTVKSSDAGKKLSNTIVVKTEDAEYQGVSGSTRIEEPEAKPDPVDPVTVTKELTQVNSRAYTGGTVYVGNILTYTITVKNNTNSRLSNIEVEDDLPTGLLLLNSDVKDIDLLAAGGSETFTVNAVVVMAGKLTNTATVQVDRETYSDTVSVTAETVYNPRPSLNTQDHLAYIIGYVDGTVRPENTITRAEVATIFFRLLTDESRALYWSQTNSYTDVKATDWWNNAISTLSNAGIITGYTDGTFRPEAPITRAEFAAIAARFSDVVYNGSCPFPDVSQTYWAREYIGLAYELGWVLGMPDGTFKPEQNITRAEAITMINRVLDRAVEEDGMLIDMTIWSDNLPTAWYYAAVQEATNSHTYTRTAIQVPGQDFNYEQWYAILANPDWAALERAWSTANSK